MDIDEFSDDGLDDLPDNALQELENNAITFTQAQHVARREPQHQRQFSDYGWDEDDDLDTSEVINETNAPIGRPLVDHSLPKQQPQVQAQQPQTAQRPAPPLPNPQWNPTVDPANRNNTTIVSRHLPSQQASHLGRPQPSQFAKPALPAQRFQPSQPSSQQHLHHPESVVSALQQRVRSLENELNAARGEVSIIRANSTKAEQQHSDEVSRLKRLNAEQVSRQEKSLEAAVAAEKTASTELQFLQQDMREANQRPRKKDAGPSKAPAVAGTITPKKSNKQWIVADGFDEMEIAYSPSKGQGRGKNAGSVAANVGERTPSKGKRKRPMVDSPVMALETHTDDVVMADKPALSSQQQNQVTIVAAPTPPFEFLQLVLDHAAFHQQPPSFDTLSRFHFPSDPATSLATHIFQTLPVMGHPQRPMQLLVDFSERIIGLWTRCYNEETWEPIKYLLALVLFTLQLHTTYVAPLIVNNLATVVQATIRRLAEGRHRLPDGDVSKSDEYKFLQQHIDTTKMLSLLYATALACVTSIMETDNGTEVKIADFWRLMSLDFVTLLLTPKQKPSDIIGMLDMLATSSLPESLGPIMEDKEPAFVARLVIERVSAKLTEKPLSATTIEEKRSVRVAALRTMLSFARHPFGATQLASHDNALPRMVTCLSDAIEDLYDQTIPQHILPQDPDAPPDTKSPSAVLYRIIGQCVLLIHTLVTDPRTTNVADIGQKLSVSYGGSQRYLISLGRLNFAEEDLVMEAGIDGEVVEMAHELLEMAVTPDEGEVVSEAFGSQG